MATALLYHDYPLLRAFNGRVVGHGTWGGRPSLVLDRTAFYPESGGQMADRGVLAGRAVLDVQVDDAGAVHHVLDGELPAVGAQVAGEIDAARRRVHMALHTGQHMLSRALLDEARGETASARLGETACTIDLAFAGSPAGERELSRAEDLANSVVDDDVPVHAWFPGDEELAAMELRRAPKVTDRVRIVRVGNFDTTPCGGTHCVRSAEVGQLRITGVEKYKGLLRVTFVAGRRARDELGGNDSVLRAMARELSCAPRDVPSALEKVRGELKEAREALGRTRAELAAALASGKIAAARASGAGRVVLLLDGVEPELLRAVARRVTGAGLVALLAARGPDGLHALVASDGSFDCGAFLRRVAQAAGGRGGGGRDHAEGRLPPSTDWESLVTTHGGTP